MLVIKWSSGQSRSIYNKEHDLLNRKHITFILSILYHIILVVRLRLYYIMILYSFIICSLMFRSLKKAMLILLCLQYFTFTLTHLLHIPNISLQHWLFIYTLNSPEKIFKLVSIKSSNCLRYLL